MDDHYLVGEGTKGMLEENSNFSVDYVSTGKDALNYDDIVDLYIIDIHMPDISGIELSEKLLLKNPQNKIILYTGFSNQESLDLFTQIGISGVISKTATRSELFNLIDTVLSGYTIVPLSIFTKPLTNKNNRTLELFSEKDLTILKYLCDGLSNKDIADKLFLTNRTVEYRLTQIYKKLEVKSRTEAVNVIISRNLLKPK